MYRFIVMRYLVVLLWYHFDDDSYKNWYRISTINVYITIPSCINCPQISVGLPGVHICARHLCTGELIECQCFKYSMRIILLIIHWNTVGSLSNAAQYNTIHTSRVCVSAIIDSECKSEYLHIKDTSYITLKCELLAVYYEDLKFTQL